MKRLLLAALFFAPLPALAKGEVSVPPPAPAKMTAAPSRKAADKPAPNTDKRVFHLELKK